MRDRRTVRQVIAEALQDQTPDPDAVARSILAALRQTNLQVHPISATRAMIDAAQDALEALGGAGVSLANATRETIADLYEAMAAAGRRTDP